MKSTRKIPLSVPNLKGNEVKYVNKSLEENWVSTSGPAVANFEHQIKKYVDSKHAVAVQSGTAGLHLALQVLGVNHQCEVFVPSLTFIASVNPIRYLGAEPIFLDVDDSLCIDNNSLEFFIQQRCVFTNGQLINKDTCKIVAGIVYVHVFGNTGKFEITMDLAKKYNLFLLEDATEALGSRYIKGRYKGKFLGTIGDAGVYSFNGNKIITTGGGGMVVTNKDKFADNIRYLSTQAKDDKVYFIHNQIGYNYRMTSTQAAMGLAQLEMIEEFIRIKQQNFKHYKKRLEFLDVSMHFMAFNDKIYSNHWFYSLNVNRNSFTLLKKLLQYLEINNIEVRPIWTLNHKQDPFANCQKTDLSNSEFYYDNLLNLPCSTNLTPEDVEYVITTLIKGLEELS
jgi:aminotransferase in exopolysaccharide biosynthesis